MRTRDTTSVPAIWLGVPAQDSVRLVGDPVHPARTKDIFARGHFFEELMRQHLLRVGFKFAPSEQLEFVDAGGLFRGHADGVLLAGPELPELRYPCLWECKCLNAKGWKAIERDGLVEAR